MINVRKLSEPISLWNFIQSLRNKVKMQSKSYLERRTKCKKKTIAYHKNSETLESSEKKSLVWDRKRRCHKVTLMDRTRITD